MRWSGGSPSETPQYAALRGVTKSATAAACAAATREASATAPTPTATLSFLNTQKTYSYVG
jgi:hypothetical protein